MKRTTEKLKPILNIGCGTTRIPNSVGLDIVDIPGYTDVVHDLNQFPYPFPANTFQEIHMYHVLEHLKNPIKTLEEIHRILKPQGKLVIRVPHFSSMGAFTDLTHVRPFGYGSFDCLEKDNYHHFYTSVQFKIEHKEIRYFGLYSMLEGDEEYFKRPYVKVAQVAEFFMNKLINLSPVFFERLWCYWVGGANEVYAVLKKEVK